MASDILRLTRKTLSITTQWRDYCRMLCQRLSLHPAVWATKRDKSDTYILFRGEMQQKAIKRGRKESVCKCLNSFKNAGSSKFYVITVGAERPVYSCIFESLSATSTWDEKQNQYMQFQKKAMPIHLCELQEHTAEVSYQWSKGILWIPAGFGGILFVLLNVDTNGGTNRTSSRETEHLECQDSMLVHHH